MTSQTDSSAKIGLLPCVRHKRRDDFTRALVMDYEDQWTHAGVRLDKSNIHLIQCFTSKVDARTLGVEQTFSLTFANPDQRSPIATIQFASAKRFVKTPKNTLPVLGSSAHVIYVVPHPEDDGGNKLVQTLRTVVPSAPCFCGDNVCTTEAVIPRRIDKTMFLAFVGTAYNPVPTKAYLIGRYEGEPDIPPAFNALCEQGAVSETVTIGNAALDLAERFYAFSRIESMLAKGQQPFTAASLGQKAVPYSKTL